VAECEEGGRNTSRSGDRAEKRRSSSGSKEGSRSKEGSSRRRSSRSSKDIRTDIRTARQSGSKGKSGKGQSGSKGKKAGSKEKAGSKQRSSKERSSRERYSGLEEGTDDLSLHDLEDDCFGEGSTNGSTNGSTSTDGLGTMVMYDDDDSEPPSPRNMEIVLDLSQPQHAICESVREHMRDSNSRHRRPGSSGSEPQRSIAGQKYAALG
jgi:hypothetical protein